MKKHIDVKSGSTGNQAVDTIPYTCPHCKRDATLYPQASYMHPAVLPYKEYRLSVIYICPNPDCQRLFAAFFDLGEGMLLLRQVVPYIPNPNHLPDQVKIKFPDFVTIFDQANHAESIGLNLICGLGYRKAFESLIKHYFAFLNPAEADKIKSSRKTYDLIKKYTKDDRETGFLMKAAAWMGNDHAHPEAEWKEMTIDDLKNVIHLISAEINAVIERKNYAEKAEARETQVATKDATSPANP